MWSINKGMAILYDSQVTHERVLEDAPLFFVDLDRGVRGMMDCLCDADLARVGYERPKFRAERKAPLDTLGILDGSVEDPNKRMSASERLRMEARDVWSEDELEYPEVRYAASFSASPSDAPGTPAAPSTRRPRHRRDAVPSPTPSPRRRHSQVPGNAI